MRSRSAAPRARSSLARRSSLTLLPLLAFACSDPAPVAPDPAPVATGDEAPPPEPAPTAAAVDAAFMLEAARGERALADHVDPTRGVAFVVFTTDASGEDPRAGRDGVIREAVRVCGEALAARLTRVHTDLRLRVEQTSHDPLFTCEAGECRHDAEMEYDMAGVYRFRPGPAAPVLDSVVRIEGGPISDEFEEAGRRFAAEQLARLADAPCE